MKDFLNPSCSNLKHLALRMLDHNPKNRPTAKEVLEKLQNIVPSDEAS